MTILLYCMRNMLQKRKKYSKIWEQKLTKCTKYVNFNNNNIMSDEKGEIPSFLLLILQ